jgi:hypothetical protein
LDVIRKYVSTEKARDIYGVIIEENTHVINWAETTQQRVQLKSTR